MSNSHTLFETTTHLAMQATQGKAQTYTSTGILGMVAISTMTLPDYFALGTSILGFLWFFLLIFKYFHRKEWQTDEEKKKNKKK